MELPSFAPPSSQPIHFNPKPKILYVADTPNWSFDRKGRDYRKYLPELEIDIGFANDIVKTTGRAESHYRHMESQKHYDVIWHLHEFFISDEAELKKYVKHHNARGTKVILTINQLYNLQDIENRRGRFSAYNAISANSPYCYFKLMEAGLSPHFTPDGYPGETFGPDIPVEKRPFKVMFVSSKLWMEHKGFDIWLRVRDRLEPIGVGFIEVLVDSYNNPFTFEQMNDLYNQAQIFVCMSRSEGGPCTLQESAGCGVVPICTKVGYTEYLKNIFIVNRDADSFIEKILYLKANPDVVKSMSRGVIREAYHWQSRLTARKWGHFVESELVKNKGLMMG